MHAAIWTTEKVYRPKKDLAQKKILGAFSSKMRQHFFLLKEQSVVHCQKSQDFYALILLDSDHQFTVTDQ